MILGRSLFNDRGDCLAAAGIELSARRIRQLQSRGYMSIAIADALSEDIVVHEVVSERVRSVTIQRLSSTFEALSQSARQFSGAGVDAISEGIQSGAFANSPALFDSLWGTVRDIVSQVLAAENLSGLADLQSYDDYTFGHSVDMAAGAVMIGKLIQLDNQSLHQIAMGSLLHDIGKIFIDQGIVRKADELTPEEQALLMQHPEWGYELMKTEDWGDVLTRHVVFQHHERQDGSGYPRGLKGTNRIQRSLSEEISRERILLLAEVAAVADVYDALSSDRPYRAAFPHDKVIKTVEEMSGSHLNAEIVRYFLSVTPVFPPGMEVLVSSGEMAGCRALVISAPPDALDRPLIRIFSDPRGVRIEPFDADLRQYPDVTLVGV